MEKGVVERIGRSLQERREALTRVAAAGAWRGLRAREFCSKPKECWLGPVNASPECFLFPLLFTASLG